MMNKYVVLYCLDTYICVSMLWGYEEGIVRYFD